jgi:enediyne biosynthesis protein E4
MLTQSVMKTGMACAFSALVLVAGCGTNRGSEAPENARDAARPADQRLEWFTDRAAESGLNFTHVNGASGHYYYPEILPPGVALFDYDNDRDLDVYIVQGRSLDPRAPAPPSGQTDLRGRLYRNDLEVRGDGTPVLHFTDVTEQSGIEARGYGLGVAAGDINNDGWVDLYLMNFGPNQMLRNNGNGTFTDVTTESGTGNGTDFGVSAAFVDYDRDGWLDLYVGNNVNYTLANETKCPNHAGAPDYCPPQVYGGRPDRVFRNLGHGTFADVTKTALIGGRFGPALGISTADFNRDGWIDIFVANDGRENLLWMNQQNGTFKEVGLTAGVAVTADGKAESSMGVDAGDFDNDGDEDLIMTELTGEGSNLYVNDGGASFRDASAQSGIGPFSLPYTGWGTTWFDYDNDGWLDLLAVNGTIIAQEGHQNAFPYDQRKLLLKNLGTGRFDQVTSQAGAVFALSASGRGAAFGDIDNDGDIDVVVGNDAGPVQLLINNIGNRNHWVGLRLTGGTIPRDMLGARVGVTRKNGPTLWRRARSDGSYGSANDPRVMIGLGSSAEPVRVQVRWPDGRSEEWPEVPTDRWTTLAQGSGQ